MATLNNQQQATAIALYREGKSPQVIADFLGVDVLVVRNFFQFNIRNSKDILLEGLRQSQDGAFPSSIVNTGTTANILGIVKSISGTGTLALVTVQPINATADNPLGATFVAQANDMYSVRSDPSQPATSAAGTNFGVGFKVIVNGTITGQAGDVFIVTLMTSGLIVSASNGAVTIDLTLSGTSSGNTFTLNGTTDSVSLVAGNNITLSSSASTITIIGAAGGTGGATFTLNGSTGSVSLVAGSNITLASNASTITISGPNVVTSLNGSNGSLSVSAGANIGIGQANSTITVSASNQSALVSISTAAGGATSGSVNTASSTAFQFVAGSNITLSQLSTNPSITIIGPNTAAATNFSLNGTSSSVSLVAGANITFNSGASSITIVGPAAATQSLSGGGTSVTGTAVSLALVGGNNISLASASGAGSLTLTINASSNALNNVSLLNGSSGALSLSSAGGISLGVGASSITISYSGTSNFTGLSLSGNTSSTTAFSGNSLIFSAQGILSFTGSTNASGGTISMSVPAPAAATNFSLNGSSSSVSLLAGANIAFASGASSITISASVQTSSISMTALGNTTSSSAGTFSNLLNISGAGIISVGVGAQSVTISATVPAATNFSLNGSSSSVSLVAGANVGFASGASSITISASNAVWSLNGSSSTLSISAGANIGIGQANSTITISASNQSVLTTITSAAGGATSGTANTASSTAFALVAGSNITLSQLSTSPNITIIGPAAGAGSSVLTQISTAAGGTTTGTLNTASSTLFDLVAGNNITLSQNSTGPNITVIGGGVSRMSFTQNIPLQQVGNVIVSASGTVTGTAGVGSSLFLQRIFLADNMAMSEIDAAMSIGFNATSNGAGTMSRSFVLYSFGNSTSLASLVSASSTSAWTTGTSTAGGSVSLTQFQGGWSSPLIQPMTFVSTLVTAGEYVVGQLFNFAQASSTWTVNFYGGNANQSFLASAATNLTSATLSAASTFTTASSALTAFTATPTAASVMSSAGLLAASAFTASSVLSFTAWSAAPTFNVVVGTPAATSNFGVVTLSGATSTSATSSTQIVGTAESGQQVLGIKDTSIISKTALGSAGTFALSAMSYSGLSAGSFFTASGSNNVLSNAGTAGVSLAVSLVTASLAAVTNVGLGALNSSTLAQTTLPAFGYIGTGSTTSGLPTVFIAGIMSTGAAPASIAVTSSAVTYSGSTAFQQPWFALVGA